MSTEAEITRQRSFSIIWIVPFVALLVGSYLVYKELLNHGPQITIVFDEGSGLEAGKTQLQYKGLNVGVVKSVALTPGLEKVEAIVELDKSAKGLARQGSKFWILRPEIGFEGIRGLNTLISGPTIQVAPGVGRFEKNFVGLERAPHEGGSIGYHYLLQVKTLGSLKIGSPVLYREYKVGEVVDTYLSSDSTSVMVKIIVNSPFDKLVRVDSHFWNASGVAMKVGLLGAKIQTNSLESILAGGIMFATPYEDEQIAELAPENTVFELYQQQHEKWLDWEPPINLELDASSAAESMTSKEQP